MYEVEHAHSDNGIDIYQAWLDSLQDRSAKARITTRVDRAANGNFGDNEPVGHGVRELKIHYGPGYRVYFAVEGTKVILLLGGGTKKSQQKDIDEAVKVWLALKGELRQ
ncbi:type II toxin-antitoxin system RelE/ParE family toxin [Pseudomonas flexibilis]|uniref:Putative addiction module killer protein n=1 Tax=Pseudomonas flexibilis TaxID=706570 RepID=A0A1N6VZ44_9PSED|nr:type II toxin-antitoxin system RelE/ParE family toxin [Pseudomonas flexibilis]SIQ83094.1 putative addiction module killer protein [Pseudomonas flexibilis]